MIPNNTAIMKGGDFNATEAQFVPILFDKYSELQGERELMHQLQSDECRLNFYFNIISGMNEQLVINKVLLFSLTFKL